MVYWQRTHRLFDNQQIVAIDKNIFDDIELVKPLILANAQSKKPILAFDRDCGPCTRLSRLVDRLDIYDKIELKPLSIAEKEGLLNRMPQSLRYSSFHIIMPDGNVKSGPEGVMQLIAILPFGRIMYPIINSLPGGNRVVRFVYYRLAKLRNSGGCSSNRKP